MSSGNLKSGRRVHLVIACGLMLAATGGWVVARHMGLALSKEAVPWPPKTIVSDDFRLVSLPDRLGPFEKLPAEDPIFGRESRQRGGEIVLTQDVMESLGVGTGYDKDRYPSRKSNWYVSRMYRDTREELTSPYRYWQLDVTYYTGSLDTVPHIPDVCLIAGGAQTLQASLIDFADLKLGNGWDSIKVNRLPFLHRSPDGTSSRQLVQYYAFSCNGQPEHSREWVRLTLTNPFQKYAYFAKFQFAPRGGAAGIIDLEEADRRAQEFARHFLPSVLENLPTKQDIQTLEEKQQPAR